jgi:L-alanine-DL-glutamate epimerase-like enolase superfamily enzyme
VLTRRRFLPTLASAPLFASAKPLKITAVEISRLQGQRDDQRGVNRQFQTNPIHIYEELRPRPYRDEPSPTAARAGVTALYLTIKTDQGVEGLYGPIDREAAIVVKEQLTTFLLGKDALAGEKLWDQMYRSNRHSRRGHFLMAISAIDNTLWDLRGRYYKTPVYRLLGGPTRTSVEAYASCLGYSLEPDKLQARAKAFKDAGFRHQKWFLAYGPGDGPAGLSKNVEAVRLLREAVGEETELMFDVFMGWDLTYALAWAKQVEKYHPRWIEEAMPAERIGAFVELRRGTSIPVASGEHIQGRWEVYEYMKAGALQVLQCDPEWCGGISELVKICSIASLYDVPVIPHGHSIHSALHTVASQSPSTCPLVENLMLKMSSYHHFEKTPPALKGAFFVLPEAPGFGIELDPAKIEKQSLM